MTASKQSGPALQGPNERRGWAPRLVQESRLRQLEDELAHQAVQGDNGLALEIERAALLGALDRQQEAQLAFVDILRRSPRDFSALNEFGALLTHMGAIDAACRVYAEAILHHPHNPMGHVNLANLLLRTSKHAQARDHYEAALRVNPNHAEAHQGMGAVLSDLGDRVAARHHFQIGYRDHAVSTLPYRGDKPPVPLLQLVSSGGGNIPTSVLLDDNTFLTSVIVADYVDPSITLPPHRLIFNAIGDADLCKPALEAAIRLTSRTSAPVINDPRAVMRSSRIDNARRLGAVPHVVTPKTNAFPRGVLADSNGAVAVADIGVSFPLLLRSPGYHTGRNFILVEAASQLSAAVDSLPGDELLVIQYLDARGHDGNARKYRVMIIDGEIYPLHLAISRNWKVHYFTSDMTDEPDHRSEESRFLTDMPAVIGRNAMSALERIGAALELDYAGVDFGIASNGDLLLFEANATMVIAVPDADERWNYRRKAITGVIDAVMGMIMKRAGAVPPI